MDHTLQNFVRSLIMLMAADAKTKNGVFSQARMDTEKRLGRAAQMAKGKSVLGQSEALYSWQWTKKDIDTINSLHKHPLCKTPFTESSRWTMPEIVRGVKKLKMNDARNLLWCFPYVLLQTSITSRDNSAAPEIASALYALSRFPAKVHLRDRSKLSEPDRERFRHEKDLDQLQEDLDNALGDLAAKLPTFFTAQISKEQLHWFAHQISRAGTFKDATNIDFESFNRVYKKWITSSKDPGKSLDNNYHLAELVLHTSLLEGKLDRAIFEVPHYLKTKFCFEAPRVVHKNFETTDVPFMANILRLYKSKGLTTRDPEMPPTAEHVLARILQLSANEYATTPLESLLPPDCTPEDRREFEEFTATFTEHKSIKARGVLFTSAVHELRQAKSSAWDNTGIMMDYLDNNDKLELAFGVIARIYVHQMSPRAEQRPIVEVRWFEKIGHFFDEEMPIVRDPAEVTDKKEKAKRSYKEATAWNQHNRFAFLSDIHAQNVVYWPRDIWVPTSPDKVALWSRAAYRPLDD